jgi:SAM-dependent MidA family methyltransferase
MRRAAPVTSATFVDSPSDDVIEDPVPDSRYKGSIMQHPQSFSLPAPDAPSTEHSEKVAAYVREKIEQAGGLISFAEYMHHCLYAPGLGYYSAGTTKFGAAGDFVTAPEVSSIFGMVLARQCAELLPQIPTPAILEIGAGSGKLAVDLLRALEDSDALPEGGYQVLEVSADLRARQEQLLREELPGFVDSVTWLDQLPRDFSGVIVANEVLDALPVERFVRRGDSVSQVCVTADGTSFALAERGAPDALRQAVENIESSMGRQLPEGYASEVCVAARHWVEDLARSLEYGFVFLFDYGVGRNEYYAAERSGGWLRCHFRHHAHDDPLILPGIQDLTSWVDFTAVAEAAVASGLDIAGFVAQAQFLIGGGLDQVLADFAELPTDAQLKLAAEIKLLTLPAEMGENFKCLGLCRGDMKTPGGFALADRTTTLG